MNLRSSSALILSAVDSPLFTDSRRAVLPWLRGIVISSLYAWTRALGAPTPFSGVTSHLITCHRVDKTIISILFFFPGGKAQIQPVVDFFARGRGHRLAAHISPDAENHQQP